MNPFRRLFTLVSIVLAVVYIVAQLGPFYAKYQESKQAIPGVTIPDITIPDTTIPDITIPTAPTPTAPQPVDLTTGSACNSPIFSTTAADATAALDVLSTILVANEVKSGYERELFPHWNDIDGDGFDGRQQALGYQSLTDPPVDNRYRVVSGHWCDPYGTTAGRPGVIITDPGALDVDHLVPLKEGWESGANTWDTDRREQFANDPATGHLQASLVAVDAGQNRSKGDKDPSQWMPNNPAVRCGYAVAWVNVKARWGLTMDASEYGYLTTALTTCAQGGVPKQPGGGA